MTASFGVKHPDLIKQIFAPIPPSFAALPSCGFGSFPAGAGGDVKMTQSRAVMDEEWERIPVGPSRRSASWFRYKARTYKIGSMCFVVGWKVKSPHPEASCHLEVDPAKFCLLINHPTSLSSPAPPKKIKIK